MRLGARHQSGLTAVVLARVFTHTSYFVISHDWCGHKRLTCHTSLLSIYRSRTSAVPVCAAGRSRGARRDWGRKPRSPCHLSPTEKEPIPRSWSCVALMAASRKIAPQEERIEKERENPPRQSMRCRISKFDTFMP